MNQQEKALIRKAQLGDTRAFEVLVRKYDKQILRLALDMVNNVEDARDVYQEVFLRAYKSLPKFRFQSDLFTWLYRITVNYCINFRKKKYYRSSFHVDFPVDGDCWLDETAGDSLRTPYHEIEKKDFEKHLIRIINTLPGKQRVVFTLRHFHDQKLSEIAEAMNWKLGTVKNSLFRATQTIRKYFSSLETV